MKTTDPIHLMIIDDDIGIQRTLAHILQAKGFVVHTAATGAEALNFLKTQFINVAFVDLKLPDVSGIEIIRTIQDMSPDTLSIMVTGHASLESTIEAMNQGAYSYIIKPVNVEQLLIILKRAIERQKLIIENRELLEKLKEKNLDLLSKFNELQRKDQLLFEANEKLTKLNEMKSNFVSHVSHEFKTPLVIIRESLNMIQESQDMEEQSKKKMFESAEKATLRLIRLVMDLLDLSTIEAGKLVMKRESLDLAQLVHEVTDTMTHLSQKKNIRITRNIPKTPVQITGDHHRLIDAIGNLISNAIKYTPPDGMVTLTLKEEQDHVRLEIADTGPGLSEKDCINIFDKFERVMAEKEEGTGLGLPITKDIVELHQGKVWVESTLGKGSNFILTLPKKTT